MENKCHYCTISYIMGISQKEKMHITVDKKVHKFLKKKFGNTRALSFHINEIIKTHYKIK